MCDEHSATPLRVFVPAHLSHSGEGRWATKGIDTCIAPLIKTLNEAGFLTAASCCGHGHRPGVISLIDGRELVIARDFDEARTIEALFPMTSYGEPVGT